MNIHSKITGELLHVVHRKKDFTEGRTDIVPANEFIQCAAISLYGGQTFKPHKHIEYQKVTTMAQESWCVVSGQIKAILYDLDDTILTEVILNQGDISVTLKGGHNYECITHSIVYEYKTGPYLGQQFDKTFI